MVSQPAGSGRQRALWLQPFGWLWAKRAWIAAVIGIIFTLTTLYVLWAVHDLPDPSQDVLAAGDVIGNYLLAHVAYYEGEHIMEVIAGKNPKPLDYNRVPRATYSYPQVASLGLSEKQARDQGLKVKIGKFPLVGNAKSVILGETEGFVKIISDEESGDLLGVFILGPNATELISETALAKLLESTPWEIGASIHPHPTVSESVKEAALAVDGLAIHI